MEIADFLRNFVEFGPGETLVRWELLVPHGLTTAKISEHLRAAAEKAGFEVTDEGDTRTTVRRKSPEITQRYSPFDIDYKVRRDSFRVIRVTSED